MSPISLSGVQRSSEVIQVKYVKPCTTQELQVFLVKKLKSGVMNNEFIEASCIFAFSGFLRFLPVLFFQ